MRLSVLILLLGFSLNVLAQKSDELSKIKLKDGSELNVLITENVPGSHITVAIPGNGETKIAYEDISSIKQKGFSYNAKYIRPNGWYWEGSAGLAFGSATEDGGSRVGFELGATYSYRLRPIISVGVGVEPMFFLVNNETIFVPVFGRLKGSLEELKTTYFYSIDYGWSFAGKTKSSDAEKVEGGWFARPTLGIQTGGLCIGVGYQLQKVTTTRDSEWWWWGSNATTKEERLMKNVVFTTSFTF